MAFAPNTSTFVLVSNDTADLPNSRVLVGGSGISLQDTGPSGATLTIQPVGNLLSIYNYDISGYMGYNSTNNTFVANTLQGSGSISITGGGGTAGTTTFSVIPNSTVQNVNVANNGLISSTKPTINFIPGTNVSISVNDDVLNGTADITISASGSQSASPNLTAIAALTPSNGSLIVGSGSTYTGLALGTSGSVLTSNGTTAYWSNESGTGTVTSITAGTGLSGGTITTSGTIALSNTAVTPGSYTNGNFTVNAQGQLTAASNGSAGGGLTYTVLSPSATSQLMVINNGYIATNISTQVVFTIPSSPPAGSVFAVGCDGAGGFKISLSGGQSIALGNQIATSSIATTWTGDGIQFISIDGTHFIALFSVGNLILT